MTCHDIRDGANRVRVDVLLKWKLASWKVKGMVFVHPLPESLDEIKDRIEQQLPVSLLPFCREFCESSKTLGDHNQEQRTSLWVCWILIFFSFFFFVDDKFSIKIQFVWAENLSLCMTFTNSKTIQTKTKVFVHLNLILFDNFSFLSTFTKYRLTQKV